MKNSAPEHTGKSVQIKIFLLFLALWIGLCLFSTLYWNMVLDPQLTEKARMTIRALAGAGARPLAAAVEKASADGIESTLREMTLTANRIRLLTVPKTEIPFIAGVDIEIDYNIVNVADGRLNLGIGNTSGGKPGDVTEIPLYSTGTGELLGIAGFYHNPEFYGEFQKDVRSAYFWGTMAGLALLIVFWLMVARLLSRIHGTEQALKEKQAQIIHAGRLTALGEMATGIAHEINQPLAIIRIASDGLNRYFEKTREDSMEGRAARKIVDQVNRASGIINNMRSFVQGGSDVRDVIDLSGPVLNGVSFFREQFRIHGIHLVVDIGRPTPKAAVNANRFEQIVVNFLSNARYAVERKAETAARNYEKEISVKLFHDPESGDAVLEVADNGTGMSKDVAGRCMEPFFTTREVGDGMGLGLSIVHGIVKENKMTIRIDSREGEGTRFQVYVRRVDQQSIHSE